MSNKFNIKKISLWLLVAMVVSFIIAGSIFLINGYRSTFSAWFDNGESQSQGTVDTEKNFDAEGIKYISINTVSEDINIIPSDADEIKVHFHGRATGLSTIPELTAEQNGDRLTVKLEHRAVIGINFGSSNFQLDVYLPESYSHALKVDTVSADTRIQGFSMDTFDFHSVSGGLSSSDFKADKADLDTTSGSMNISGFTGDLDFKSVSGDMDAQYTEFNNNIRLDTVSGRMNVRLPEDSQFSVSFTSTSGDFRSDFPLTTTGTNGEHKFEGSSGNGSSKISAKSVSGDFELEK